MQPFQPTGPTIEVAVATASAATALTGGADTVRVEAPVSGSVRIAFGKAADTVTLATGMGLLAGSVETFSVPPGATHLLTIAAAAATLRVTPGLGA